MIQDANSNLVGLVGDDGALLHQYTWDPYGEPVAVERFDTGASGTSLAPFENRIEHQGLFFDRFDGGADNVLLPQLWVDTGMGLAAKGLYQNRNRSYSPNLGRFVQRDPNGSGSAILGSPRAFGQPGRLMAGGPQLETVYGNGANLFAYVGSAPTVRMDPMGLEAWKWDFEGVILPLVANVMDAVLPVSMLSPLDALLDGYRQLRTLKNRVNRDIQQPMFDREEEADWAMDWGRADDEYGPQNGTSVFYNDVESPFGPLAGRFPAKAVSNGRAAEAAARDSGKMRMGRKTTDGPLETSQVIPGQGRRFYDGVDPGNPNVMIEVKIGSQGVTERIRRQMIKDKAFMASTGRGVKWILYTRDGRPINSDLTRALNDMGIPWEPAHLGR